jgi:hypothetical protein
MRSLARFAVVALSAAMLSACSGGGASNSLSPSTAVIPDSSLVASAASQASGLTSPGPSAAQLALQSVAVSSTGPAHAPTFEQLPGNYQSSQSGWNTVGQYVSYLMTDKRATQYAANAGMKVAFYTDIMRIPVNSASQYPEAAFAHTCSGKRVFSSSSGTAAYLGNPGSSTLLSSWNSGINAMKHDQWGNYPYTVAMSDDSDNPGLSWDLSIFKVGSANGAVSTGVYCGFSTASFDSQIASLMQNAQIPIIFNGDTDPRYYTAYMAGHSNVIGGECEGCIASPYLGNGQTKVTGSTWLTQMNAGLINIANKKIFFLSADGQVPADTLGYTYASYMLMYDQNYTMFRQDGANNSGLGNPPTVNIVPTQPLKATPSNVASLNKSGVYAREYAACYISGANAGPCVALVNPDSVYHVWPSLTRQYHHMVQFGGSGAATKLGDTGYVNAKGASPGSGLNAGGWAIVFN